MGDASEQEEDRGEPADGGVRRRIAMTKEPPAISMIVSSTGIFVADPDVTV